MYYADGFRDVRPRGGRAAVDRPRPSRSTPRRSALAPDAERRRARRAPTRRPEPPPVSLLARAVFVLLVAATFSAFFVAQRLKSAPTGRGLHQQSRSTSRRTATAAATSRGSASAVRKRRRRDVSIVDDARDRGASGSPTAVPATRERAAARALGRPRPTAARRAPEGFYRVRVSLRRGGRAVTLSPGVELDVTAPRPTVLGRRRRTARDWITGPGRGPVPFRVRVVSRAAARRGSACCRTDLGEPQRGRRASRCRPACARASGTGTADGAPAPPGTYQIVAVGARPGRQRRPVRAGRARARSAGSPGVSVRGAARPAAGRPGARPARRSTFAVDSRGRPYRWRIFRVGEPQPRARRAARRRPAASSQVTRAAAAPSGVYVLQRAATGRSARPRSRSPSRARRPRRSSSCCPAITWFGRDTLDDDRDGLPNTLENGSSAAYPRLLAGGLPDGLRATRSRALLAFLDAQKIHYDVTTDLTLAASRSGLTGRAPGRAARRAAALDLDRARAPAAPLRDGGRPRRVVRRRLAAARGRRRARPAAAPAAAEPTPTRSATRLRPVRRLDGGRAARSRSPTRATPAC